MYKTESGWYVMTDKDWEEAWNMGCRCRCTRCNLPHTWEEAHQNEKAFTCTQCGGWLKRIFGR